MILVCDAKAYLRKIELLDAHITNKLNDLFTLRTMVTKITSTISPVVASGTGNQDKLGDAIAKIVDLQNEINQQIDKFVDAKREVSAVLEKLQDPDHVKVLHKRYIEYKPWEQIACEMNFTYLSLDIDLLFNVSRSDLLNFSFSFFAAGEDSVLV